MTVRVRVAFKGDWRKAATTLARAGRRVEQAIDKAIAQEAHAFRREVVQGIRRQAPGGVPFKPLAEETIKRKGSSKALIDTGDLIGSISVRRVGKAAYFVGVHRTAVGGDGRKLANVAAVHEFGSRDERIPARPFMRPTMEEFSRDARARLLRRVLRQVGGHLGEVLALGTGVR